jgi:hypothetical protein
MRRILLYAKSSFSHDLSSVFSRPSPGLFKRIDRLKDTGHILTDQGGC